MRVLVISDLHIGASARCISLVPDDEKESSKRQNDDYMAHLKAFSETLDQPIEYVVISGDIADRARIEQYLHFNEFIEELIASFAIDRDRVFFTTGNHDVDWAALEGKSLNEVAPERQAMRYQPITKSKVLDAQLEGAVGSLLEPPYFCVWQTEDLYILSVNTAAYDDSEEENHPGYISSKTLEAINQQCINDKVQELDKAKMLLMHHHPINYPNPSPSWKDFSILQCHEDIVEFSLEHDFDFIVHGHRHHPKFTSHLNSNGKQISIVCGGSFSQAFPLYIYDNLSNLLHIIDIHGRSEKGGVLQGKLYNYAFSHKRGWSPSTYHSDGIEHKISFGPNEHKLRLYEIADEYIAGQIANSGRCKVERLRSEKSEFQYKDEALIFEIIREVCAARDLELFGEKFDSSVILPKEEDE